MPVCVDEDTIREFHGYATKGVINEKSLQLIMPTLDEVRELYNPPIAEACVGGVDGEVVAWAMAVYNSVAPLAYDSHRNLTMQIAHDVGAGNLWIIPTKPRLSYPYAQLYALASMLQTEEKAGRRADWFFWLDDDVVTPRMTYAILRAAADKTDRPVVGAVGMDRNPPYFPAVWGLDGKRWRKVPRGGVHEVQCTGWVALLIHRSVFDNLPEPWFAVSPGRVTESHKEAGPANVEKGINPDTWFSFQCNRAGIPVNVCTDVQVTHMGDPIPVNIQTAAAMQKAMGLEIE